MLMIRERYSFKGPPMPQGTFEGSMEFEFRHGVPLPEELKAFRDDLWEAARDGKNVQFQIDGKTYGSIFISSMSREVS